MQTPMLFSVLSLLAATASAQGGSFDSAGVPIGYTDHGSGEPVVLIHGLTQSQDVWHRAGIVDELRDDYRVITLDLRGHGDSGKPHEPDEYGWEVGEDIIRLLDHLDIDQAHLLGYSMGAGVVAGILVRHPDRALTATLASGYFPHWDESEEGFAQFTEERGRRGDRFPWEPENQDFTALAAAIRGARFVEVSDREITAVSVPTLVAFGSDELEDVPVEARRYVTTPTEDMTALIILGANHDNAVVQPEFLAAFIDHIEAH
jgi:pimeloyl-ACP methyl ester carboxylesterase